MVSGSLRNLRQIQIGDLLALLLTQLDGRRDALNFETLINGHLIGAPTVAVRLGIGVITAQVLGDCQRLGSHSG